MKAVLYLLINRNKSLRTPGNMLVINLALSDLLLAACGFPFYAIASFHGHWEFGPAGESCLNHCCDVTLSFKVLIIFKESILSLVH